MSWRDARTAHALSLIWRPLRRLLIPMARQWLP